MATAVDTPVQNKAELFASVNAKTSGVSAANALSNASEQNDRFLKLLTTQLTNQDPLNPMDNAQMTSQMAQISTVSGLEQLNASMAALSSQFVQLQAMQGAALVGREVMYQSDALNVTNGQSRGGYELPVAAGTVQLEVMNAAGNKVATVDLGPQAAGRHSFDKAIDGLLPNTAYKFQVVAKSGKTDIDATELAVDKVTAINTSGKTLTLELQKGGDLAYAKVQSIN